MHSDLLLVIVVGAALAFDFTNGFHDTANVVAASISTRALSPRTAVTIAAALNFVGAFISLKVAATIGSGIFATGRITETIVFAGLIGAIAWNLVTWFVGLPSSSSHALIGGVAGAMLAAVGTSGVRGQALVRTVLAPGVVAPVLAFVVAGISIVLVYRVVGRRRPGVVTDGFRLGQIVSTSMLALAHGTNDAQKTMGVITLALVAHGSISEQHFHVPTWVVVSAATAIALGTYAGGWRIIRTVGTRIIKMDIAQGFTAQGAGAAVILASSHFGYPLSTTHVISGGIMGAGAAKRLSAVRWGVAGNIAVAWILTIPAAGLAGALTYGVTDIFGAGVLGPILVTILALGVVASALVHRGRSPYPGTEARGASANLQA
ncbi:MAG TPA: inorganic phosphate transporter [Solirubrobacteraceae bacterium]|nr:inorganic phosphate transporter [Solirubrobacteraceae bacterium]